eukprot:5240375-Ditylum_brightwellii.AAC.1
MRHLQKLTTTNYENRPQKPQVCKPEHQKQASAYPFYVPDNEKKLSPLDYQTYKLRTNPKDEKSAVYNLVVKYYKVGTPEKWL